ncbi:FecCD family ABC transporter permease [Sporomusa malonica]|uniref:Iron complex transport system permease protein n=1 Tax=Sporomusa malonica TaxID=112901 RepID=A0A1W2DQZ6_9FIRM|nr:iron ABC transporter permease [Sporomusa malonica]SMC99823.1 iron complex transport system permease protein [Sporomusa malonica]
MNKKILLILIVLFIGALAVALGVGRYAIYPVDIASILLTAIGLNGLLPAVTPETYLIFTNIRLPRIIMSFIIGGGISIAGAVFQGVFRNPLAAPDILGVKFGAAFGAALAIIFFTQIPFGVYSFAFAFGLTAVLSAYLLALRSQDPSASVLVIAGIVVSSLFQAALSVLIYLADPYDQLSQITFWLMGSFHTASWLKVNTILPIITVSSLLIYLFSWRLNVMTLTDEEALSLGIPVVRWRMLYILLSTLIAAASTATVGAILWVSLIVPHIARYLIGTEHRQLIPVTGFLGGIFVLLMDTLARSLLVAEIPISIVTSVFGAPFLGYLIQCRKGGELGSDRAN